MFGMQVILLILLALAGLIAWKGVGRNRGTVEQEHVRRHQPFDP